MQSAIHCQVRAYLGKGVRPHINLHGARYTSAVLACSTQFIGKRLLVYMNADDMRSVRAFLPDGTELGVLDFQGAWRLIPHTLKLRQEILKEKGNRRSPTSVEANPIEEYVQGKLAKAKNARRAASDLSQAMRVMSAASSARPPVGPPTTVTVAALTADRPSEPETEVVAAPRGPTRPRKLTIGTGQVF